MTMAGKTESGGTKESFFTNSDGKKIFCRYWSTDLVTPRALVLVVHGLGEHCLWYTTLAEELTQSGCYVFAHDHVGHGQSEGDRVHVNNFHEYVRDSFQHFDTISQQFPGVPRFVIGHSMGGAISIIAAIEKPDYFDGVILIAPAVITDPAIATPVKVQRYKDDPLVHHGGFKARWAASMLDWLDWIEENMAGFKSPLIAMHGTEDKLTRPEGSRLLVEKVSSTDKTLKMYPGYYHQLHSEPGEDGPGVRRDILEWIDSRIKA